MSNDKTVAVIAYLAIIVSGVISTVVIFAIFRAVWGVKSEMWGALVADPLRNLFAGWGLELRVGGALAIVAAAVIAASTSPSDWHAVERIAKELKDFIS